MKVEISERGTLEIYFRYEKEAHARERLFRMAGGNRVVMTNIEWTLKTSCHLSIGEHAMRTWVWDKGPAGKDDRPPSFNFIENRKRALATALRLYFPNDGGFHTAELDNYHRRKMKEIRRIVWDDLHRQGFITGRQRSSRQ